MFRMFQQPTGWSGVVLVLGFMVLYAFSFEWARKRAYMVFRVIHGQWYWLYFFTWIHGSYALVQDPPSFYFFVIFPLIIFNIDRLMKYSRRTNPLPIVHGISSEPSQIFRWVCRVHVIVRTAPRMCCVSRWPMLFFSLRVCECVALLLCFVVVNVALMLRCACARVSACRSCIVFTVRMYPGGNAVEVCTLPTSSDFSFKGGQYALLTCSSMRDVHCLIPRVMFDYIFESVLPCSRP